MDYDKIVFCKYCNCMTKTKLGCIYICGKCGNDRRKKPEVIILDDNELSILSYAQEYPENWKKICKALDKSKMEKIK